MVAGAALALAAVPVVWSAALAASGRSALPAQIELPRIPGWTRVASDGGQPWSPHFDAADYMLLGRYRDGSGRQVDLGVAIFADQEEGREIVGFGQGAVDPKGPWAWTESGAAPAGGRADLILGPGGVAREVLSFYRVGHVTTGNPVRVKIETLKVRLLGGPRRAVAVLVSAETPGTGRSARPTIDAFLAAVGPVASLADSMAGPAPSAR
jgi:EpsI family protein